ncbi:MAG TPA: histidinol-phosphate transaminase [Mycobacteriales bacterium]|nr:histidinol-phosphate transaminase [Mycobacteriales bacterium]
MTVRLRDAMASLPAYVPGRKIPGAIVLASNESPYGLLPGVADVLAERTGSVSRYPDMASAELVAAIADHHGVAPERVAVGAGSVEVCGQLAAASVSDGDEVIFGWRAFEAYPIITAVAGGSAVKVPLDDQHVHDVDAMVGAVTDRTKLVFLCNPNNPTGTAVGGADLRTLALGVPDDVLVVIDEAYREYVDPGAVPDAFELLGDRPNVVVTRTFSKAYALAGLRVGYCLAAPEVASAVRKCQVPFSVSGLAQAAAIAALGEREEVARRAKLTVAERDRVRAELLAAGYEVPRSEANFVWLPLAERSQEFAEACLARDIIVRPFAGEGVRVTIGTDTENDAFLAVARAWTDGPSGQA